MRVFEVCRFLPHIEGDEGASLAGGASNHRVPIHFELVVFGD